MRLVVDTAVMVAAIRSDTGASRYLLVAGLEARFTMLASVPLLIEYQAVMSRREHLTASRLSATDLEALLDAVAAVAEPVLLDFLWRPALPDPDDDMVLETGVNGQADAIVTFNRRHFVMVTKQLVSMCFRRPTPSSDWREGHEKEQFRVTASAVASRRGPSSGRIGGRGAQPAHQCRSGRKAVGTAHRKIFHGTRGPGQHPESARHPQARRCRQSACEG